MIPAEQTRADHVREVAAVRASLLLPDTRAERHGVYPHRRPKGVLPGPHTFLEPPAPARVFVFPIVTERRL